ncbi:cobalt ECF transporter T component CbiQ [Cumulibacter manganitolerans]|uniref:cobalt ECF transporter T component CbiQ n=1 Tax=Cumulibacter manganitolerans TaxID=1884992 RepID=UPI001E48D5BF|nr:cobalt ECF transporter T component CbiQ [Cumulibacter manganitolerans]
MGAGHGDLGYVDGRSWLHGTSGHHKIVAAFVLVLAVVAVPRGTWWPFAVAVGVLVAAAAAARLPARRVLRRMLVETPFVVFALALPIIADGPRVAVFGVPVSEPGLLAAGAMLAKATVGVLAGVVLASTTRPAELVRGLHRLRMPGPLVEIASFMLRYVSVVSDDLRRMRIARESRCFAGSGPRQARAVAASAGTLFVRSYERGERVHLAMLARGYAGTMPVTETRDTARAPLALTAGVLIVVAAAATAWWLR